MTSIGLIGLGNIGLPIAKVLIDAGHEVLGYRRSASTDFEEIGGRRVGSSREVAEGADVILCCISGDDALRDVIGGENGVASGDCTGKIVVELSTLSTEVKREQLLRLQAKGGMMLDSAISGLPPMVTARTAVYLLSGDEAAYEQARPVIEILTDRPCFMGVFGAALNTKLCANMLVAANIASTAETLAFGTKLGLDPDRLIAALRDGAGGSVQFSARAGRMAHGDWEKVLASTDILLKDILLIEKRGGDLNMQMPVLSSTRPFYEKAIAEGYGGKDVSAVYAVFAEAAGLPTPNKNGDTDK
ncbi:NAD(P)-dependent oxidoreductase [Celeribacter indicus]|uniref:6-phosphogluconate dehydrogenase n=1 Tax=Celeribacter indicus TaxID=1208324 RepID=A0A0B5E026_9RHOB|nr:NAD(P)-dependent oxidoreductase [Celeribacter indicus]AJE46735.1 6-phosphogluconate dehydrogenase [Celeribacter indicus]SDX05163.1 3-hydroxyisobutyrate dehydrogenase [Celeribacter indicus]